MSEQRCGNCRHWGTAKEADAGHRFRTCGAVVHDQGYLADPKNTQIDRDMSEECKQKIAQYRAEHKAVVLDGSGYWGALKTRDDFGCALWESRS